MTALRIGVAYTPSGGSPNYNILIDNFADGVLPRTYLGAYEFSLSATGSNILGGPAYNDKYQWVISTKVSRQEAETFDAMYRAWDADRAAGRAAAVGVTDETFGTTVNTTAIFVTPPSYTRLSPQTYVVSFGMQEI